MEQSKVNVLAERLTNELNGALNLLTFYLGYKLGLFAALAEGGPATSAELAARTNCVERYVREWLECLTANEYLEHDPIARRFSISPDLAAVLLDGDHPAYSMSSARYMIGIVPILPGLIEAFRTGGGVPFEDYGPEFREGVAASNRPMFVNELVSTWLPAMPDIEARLHTGGRVLDFGCGMGASSLALARGFPAAQVDGLDIDVASIESARRHAEAAGLPDRVQFHLATQEGDPLTGPYDLVTAFECIHDMAYPVQALRRMHELTAPGGAGLIADELVADTLAESRRLPDRLMYNFSVLHCLPQAMTVPDSAATGAIMRVETMRRYVLEAGFSDVEVLPIESPVWRFYRLRM